MIDLIKLIPDSVAAISVIVVVLMFLKHLQVQSRRFDIIIKGMEDIIRDYHDTLKELHALIVALRSKHE